MAQPLWKPSDSRLARTRFDQVSDVVQRLRKFHRHVSECFQRRHPVDAEPGTRGACFRPSKVRDASGRTERLECSEDLGSVFGVTQRRQ